MRAQYILNGTVVFEGEMVGEMVGEWGKWTRIREPRSGRVDEVLTAHVRVTETLTPGEIFAAAEQGQAADVLAPWTTHEIVSMAEGLEQRAERTAFDSVRRMLRQARGVLETERDRRSAVAALASIGETPI